MATKDQEKITIGKYLLTRLEQLNVKVCRVTSTPNQCFEHLIFTDSQCLESPEIST